MDFHIDRGPGAPCVIHFGGVHVGGSVHGDLHVTINVAGTAVPVASQSPQDETSRVHTARSVSPGAPPASRTPASEANSDGQDVVSHSDGDNETLSDATTTITESHSPQQSSVSSDSQSNCVNDASSSVSDVSSDATTVPEQSEGQCANDVATMEAKISKSEAPSSELSLSTIFTTLDVVPLTRNAPEYSLSTIVATESEPIPAARPTLELSTVLSTSTEPIIPATPELALSSPLSQEVAPVSSVVQPRTLVKVRPTAVSTDQRDIVIGPTEDPTVAWILIKTTAPSALPTLSTDTTLILAPTIPGTSSHVSMMSGVLSLSLPSTLAIIRDENIAAPSVLEGDEAVPVSRRRSNLQRLRTWLDRYLKGRMKLVFADHGCSGMTSADKANLALLLERQCTYTAAKRITAMNGTTKINSPKAQKEQAKAIAEAYNEAIRRAESDLRRAFSPDHVVGAFRLIKALRYLFSQIALTESTVTRGEPEDKAPSETPKSVNRNTEESLGKTTSHETARPHEKHDTIPASLSDVQDTTNASEISSNLDNGTTPSAFTKTNLTSPTTPSQNASAEALQAAIAYAQEASVPAEKTSGHKNLEARPKAVPVSHLQSAKLNKFVESAVVPEPLTVGASQPRARPGAALATIEEDQDDERSFKRTRGGPSSALTASNVTSRVPSRKPETGYLQQASTLNTTLNVPMLTNASPFPASWVHQPLSIDFGATRLFSGQRSEDVKESQEQDTAKLPGYVDSQMEDADSNEPRTEPSGQMSFENESIDLPDADPNAVQKQASLVTSSNPSTLQAFVSAARSIVVSQPSSMIPEEEMPDASEAPDSSMGGVAQHTIALPNVYSAVGVSQAEDSPQKDIEMLENSSFSLEEQSRDSGTDQNHASAVPPSETGLMEVVTASPPYPPPRTDHYPTYLNVRTVPWIPTNVQMATEPGDAGPTPSGAPNPTQDIATSLINHTSAREPYWVSPGRVFYNQEVMALHPKSSGFVPFRPDIRTAAIRAFGHEAYNANVGFGGEGLPWHLIVRWLFACEERVLDFARSHSVGPGPEVRRAVYIDTAGKHLLSIKPRWGQVIIKMKKASGMPVSDALQARVHPDETAPQPQSSATSTTTNASTQAPRYTPVQPNTPLRALNSASSAPPVIIHPFTGLPIDPKYHLVQPNDPTRPWLAAVDVNPLLGSSITHMGMESTIRAPVQRTSSTPTSANTAKRSLTDDDDSDDETGNSESGQGVTSWGRPSQRRVSTEDGHGGATAEQIAQRPKKGLKKN